MARELVDRIVLTVDDSHLLAIQTVANALRAAGMRVESVLTSGGIITGEVDRGGIARHRSVPGVSDVEHDGEMRAI